VRDHQMTVEEKLNELHTSTDEAWDELKKGVDNAWTDLSWAWHSLAGGFQKAGSKLKHAETAGRDKKS
jgi:hypothetical protein